MMRFAAAEIRMTAARRLGESIVMQKETLGLQRRWGRESSVTGASVQRRNRPRRDPRQRNPGGPAIENSWNLDDT